MTDYLLSLNQITADQVEQVGTKAATLGRLRGDGFPVPPGLCLTTAAFRLALKPQQAALTAILARYDLSQPAAARIAAETIARLLVDLALPQGVAQALQARLPDLVGADTPLAVRSSATLEDRPEASFAGQYTTVIGVRGAAAVAEAILACWRSFFSPQALVARAGYDWSDPADRPNPAMAVLIQPMIQAECAGVCFSRDPVRPERARLVINAAWGLGGGVVDGRVAGDTVWLDRNTFWPEKQQLAEKTEQLVLTETGLQAAPVPAARRRAACLPEAWLTRLAEFALALEQRLGRPQDLEWAIAEEQVWLLQSRPITALPPEWVRPPPFPVIWEDDQARRSLWRRWDVDPRGLAQFPLELDLWAQLESTWDESCRQLGVERRFRFKQCNGRLYAQPAPIAWTAADRRVRRAAREDLLARLQRQNLTTWDYWGPEIVAATERLRRFDCDGADDPALADHLEEALAVRRRHFMLHPLLAFKPGQAYFQALAAISNLAEAELEAKLEATAYRFLEVGQTPLTDLVDRLYQLACAARHDEALVALITAPPDDFLARLGSWPAGRAWLSQLEGLLAHYGERTGQGYGSEMPFRIPTWAEQPAQVLPLIAPFLDPAIEPPAARRARVRQVVEAEIEALCAACSDEAAVAEFRAQLAYARRVYTVLEIHNHYIDQMSVGQLRQAVMAAARRLTEQGILTGPDQVMWLTFDQLLLALRTEQPDSVAETIAARQAAWAEWETFTAPPILGLPAADLPARPPLTDQISDPVTGPLEAGPGRLIGLAAGRGRYRGRARVIHDNINLPQLNRGEVLVAANIGPMWTPLLPTLGALVLERGSVGQHAAAIAREYGLPVVVGLRRATALIPDGAWVTVDGARGVVELAEE